jgi:hypothetical protein
VLFVDDDQLQVRQRGQDRQPRAQHDARAALVGGQPVQHALAFGQAAVQGGQHHAGEARADVPSSWGVRLISGTRIRIWASRLARQHLGAGLQVDLGLAAAGHAVQQQRREALAPPMASAASCWAGFRTGMSAGVRVVRILVLGQLLERAVQRHRGRQAQVLRQARQRHLAQRTLVIIGGEARPAPATCGDSGASWLRTASASLSLSTGTSVSVA